MINATIEKFGHPATLIREYQHWVVLLRPAQVTLGSLVLAAKSPATAYGQLPASAFAEQALVVGDIERALTTFCGFDRINYMMLMMIDPHVHLHVIPRYEGKRQWNGLEFADAGWPGPPDLKSAVALDEGQIAALRDELSGAFDG
jgi:diadenosine tetraphosphate (Ap4A) HIT family hydrolase